jgi:hypothetical protein
MVKHIVFWKFKDSIPADQRPATLRDIKQKFEALNGVIPGMRRLEIGGDFSRNQDSFDFVLYSEFDSREALDGYQDHPKHRELIPFLGALRSEKRMVDYDVT